MCEATRFSILILKWATKRMMTRTVFTGGKQHICVSHSVMWMGCWWTAAWLVSTASPQVGLQAVGWVQMCSMFHSRAQAGGPTGPGVCSSHVRWQEHKSGAEGLLRKGTRSRCPYSMGQCRLHGQAHRQWGRKAWVGEGRRNPSWKIMESTTPWQQHKMLHGSSVLSGLVLGCDSAVVLVQFLILVLKPVL